MKVASLSFTHNSEQVTAKPLHNRSVISDDFCISHHTLFEVYFFLRSDKAVLLNTTLDVKIRFPISNEAYKQLGVRTESDERVFRGIKYSRIKLFLCLWLTKAGIEKNEFYFPLPAGYFRDFTLILGTDIHTVMRMLGPKSLMSTQRYLHLIDKVKKEASGKISLSYKTLSDANIMDLLMKELKEINQKLAAVTS